MPGVAEHQNTSFQLLKDSAREVAIAQRDVAQVVDRIVVTNHAVPSFDQLGVHLVGALERALAVFDDVFVPEVGVRGEKGSGILLLVCNFFSHAAI